MKIDYRTLGLVSVMSWMAAASLYAADAAKGKEVFEKKCAMCHAKDLKGNPAMAKMFKLDPSALNLVKKETHDKKDADLLAITTKGKDKMPAQEGKLSADDIANAVAYIRSASGGK
jgi:cytochrome c6